MSVSVCAQWLPEPKRVNLTVVIWLKQHLSVALVWKPLTYMCVRTQNWILLKLDCSVNRESVLLFTGKHCWDSVCRCDAGGLRWRFLPQRPPGRPALQALLVVFGEHLSRLPDPKTILLTWWSMSSLLSPPVCQTLPLCSFWRILVCLLEECVFRMTISQWQEISTSKGRSWTQTNKSKSSWSSVN